MVRQDIFEGLKSAMIRGYSLKEAMQSFYNAGYEKKDIEDAARELYKYQQAGQTIQGTTIQQPSTKEEGQKIQQSSFKPIPQQQIQKQTSQDISSYGEEKKYPRDKFITFFLMFVLFILIGFLIFAFLFKEQIIDFFGKFFGQ